jgi:hypothetical protein
MCNKLINSALALIFFTCCFGCKETGPNDANLRKMQDTLFKLYPTVNRVSVEVKENQDVEITLGDAQLYNAPEAERQKITDEIAALTVKVFEKDNFLEKGTVIFVKEENTIDVKEADKKKYDMHIEKLLPVGK